MDVVEQHGERRPPRDVAEQAGEPLQQARERWIPLGQRAANERDPAEQAREIVEQPFAELDDLAVGECLQERVHRLGPEAEGGAGGERIALREQSGHLAVASQQLAPEPALACSGLALQEHDPELAGHGTAELIVQRRQLVAATDELGAQA